MTSKFKQIAEVIIKFHNNNVKIEKYFVPKVDRNKIMRNLMDIVGTVYDNNSVFLMFNEGDYVFVYEDENGNPLIDSEPIVMLKDPIRDVEDSRNAFSLDFADNFQNI